MTEFERNRQIVQEGLRRRAAQRKEAQEDARHDAAERALRAKINGNYQTRRLEAIATEEVQRRNAERIARGEAQRVAEIRRKKRAQNQEAVACSDWYCFLIKVFAPLLIGALILSLTTHDPLPFGPVPIVITAPFAIVGCMVAVDTFASRYLTKQKQ